VKIIPERQGRTDRQTTDKQKLTVA